MIQGLYERSTLANAEQDTVRATDGVSIPRDGSIAKLSALLAGGGPNSGVQAVRGVLWAEDEVVAATTDVQIPDSAAEGWYDLWFPEPVDWAAGQLLHLGLAFGGLTKAIRYGQAADTKGLAWADTFTDGTGDIPAHTATPQPVLFATYAERSVLPVATDLYYANLGFYSAQEKLGSTQVTTEHHRLKAGWHGTWLDSEPQGASLAIVDAASAAADALLGERVRIWHQNRSVCCYVHRVTDLDSDGIELSLSRRAFAALAVLSTEELDVRVEVLA